MSKENKGCSYLIGYVIGFLFTKSLMGLLRLLWAGIVKASMKSKVVLIFNKVFPLTPPAALPKS